MTVSVGRFAAPLAMLHTVVAAVLVVVVLALSVRLLDM